MKIKDNMANLKFILYALLFILFLLFIVQNYVTLTAPHSLRLNLVLTHWETVPLPLYLLALLLFFLGFFLALLLNVLPKQRLKKELRDCRQQKKDLEQQLKTRQGPVNQTASPSSKPTTGSPGDTQGI